MSGNEKNANKTTSSSEYGRFSLQGENNSPPKQLNTEPNQSPNTGSIINTNIPLGKGRFSERNFKR